MAARIVKIIQHNGQPQGLPLQKNMFVVEIENLTKDYETGFWKKKKVRALDGLTLSVEGGQIFGFLGANGAGKTTTIKLLMRLIYPNNGSAKILGKDISDVSMHSRIGYLPENPYFYDYLTARELMDYCAELFGLSSNERKKRTENLLTRVGLEEKSWNRQLRKFSKGMLQRVGLAQALVNNPEVVFLDEPMSGLDPVGRRQVRDLIASLRDEGKTVFMSSHILSDIEALCDRVAILQKGKLAHTGRLEELREKSGEKSGIEIIVVETNADAMKDALKDLPYSMVSQTTNGARIEVSDEKDVDKVLSVLRQLDGRLVSVQPIKQSLEELFVSEIKS